MNTQNSLKLHRMRMNMEKANKIKHLLQNSSKKTKRTVMFSDAHSEATKALFPYIRTHSGARWLLMYAHKSFQPLQIKPCVFT